MADSQFARFLRRAMALLSEECPGAFHELCAKLEGAKIQLRIDGHAVSPSFGAGGFELVGPHVSPDVDLESGREAILAVLDGRMTLEEAVWQERVVLKGSLDALAKFHDGFVLCVGGAVRCPSFPRLLERYRGARSRASGDPR